MRIFPLLALSLLAPAAAAAQSVTVERGNLYVRAPGDSAPRQITSSGRDRDASFSPDKHIIAFIRGTPGDSVDAGSGRADAGELWIIGADGRGARMLARGRDDQEPTRILAGMQSPRFSPDGGRIYFTSAAWATSGAIHVVEVTTGVERYVAPGDLMDVVPSGKYAGHLIASQHRYFLTAGSYDWLWLLTSDGVDVGPVGESEAALEEFREMYVDQ